MEIISCAVAKTVLFHKISAPEFRIMIITRYQSTIYFELPAER